jgi:PPK2 family polyphosphate:nucleotide phosphotransferase
MAKIHEKEFLVPTGGEIKLSDYDPASTGPYKDKNEAQSKLAKDVEKLAELQDVLYASQKCALLIVLQGMDTAGKDSIIKHVMSGMNPQGVHVKSFKQPSIEELRHDFLWRAVEPLPGRGYIGIYNRSYYEEVLVTRVHNQILKNEGAAADTDKKFWQDRYESINNFERHLTRNGTAVLKFFLNLAKDEQRRRLLARIEDESKNWKFSAADLHERAYWTQYHDAFQEMFCQTSTEYAPWYLIPADHKWFSRVAVADIVVKKLESLGLSYPKLPAKEQKELANSKKLLEND